MSGYALRAEGLTKTFGEGTVRVRAVRDVTLQVSAGEVVLIMGPSGSGKTTLLSMLGAMLRPTSGRIQVDGTDLAALPERKLPEFRARRFGFVFQDFNLLSALSAEENVEFALNLSGMTGAVPGTAPGSCSTNSASPPGGGSGPTSCPAGRNSVSPLLAPSPTSRR